MLHMKSIRFGNVQSPKNWNWKRRACYETVFLLNLLCVQVSLCVEYLIFISVASIWIKFFCEFNCANIDYDEVSRDMKSTGKVQFFDVYKGCFWFSWKKLKNILWMRILAFLSVADEYVTRKFKEVGVNIIL